LHWYEATVRIGTKLKNFGLEDYSAVTEDVKCLSLVNLKLERYARLILVENVYFSLFSKKKNFILDSIAICTCDVGKQNRVSIFSLNMELFCQLHLLRCNWKNSSRHSGNNGCKVPIKPQVNSERPTPMLFLK
jgi:hypothetical protein